MLNVLPPDPAPVAVPDPADRAPAVPNPTQPDCAAGIAGGEGGANNVLNVLPPDPAPASESDPAPDPSPAVLDPSPCFPLSLERDTRRICGTRGICGGVGDEKWQEK